MIRFVLFLNIAINSAAFKILPLSKTNPPYPSSLKATLVFETDDDARYLFSRAQNCAYGEECPVDEARGLLQQMLDVQAECTSGTLNDKICQDQDAAADIVAHLRVKASSAGEMTLQADRK